MNFRITLANGDAEMIGAEWVTLSGHGNVQFLGDHTVGTPLGDCLITMYAAGTWTRVDKETSDPARL